MNKFTSLFALISIALLFASPAYAVYITVDSDCRLADAIRAANTDSAVGECPAGNGADTITLSGNVTLDANLPPITSDITIEGSGYTISGNSEYRIFGVNGGTLTVNELTMTKGNADWGGAIYSIGGILTITNSSINGSWAPEGGAIGNEGTLTITNSAFSSNSANVGSVIHSTDGRITITDSAFNNNMADTGGAVYNENSPITITNSQFSSNSANEGGAIHSTDGRITITDSVFTSNTAKNSDGGAIHNVRGNLVLTNNTMDNNSADDNGGAIYNSNEDDTLIVTRNSFNSNSAGRSGGAIYNTGVGGITIRFGSPDANNLFSIEKERIRIDESVFNANSSDNGGAIYNADHKGTVSNSEFNSNSAKSNGGALNNSDGHIILTNTNFNHNSAFANGGAISVGSYGKLGIVDSVYSDNSANQYGGAIFIRSDTYLGITGSSISGNSTGQHGSTIFVDSDGGLIINNSTINDNLADESGGLYVAGTATITHVTMMNNSATDGGGLYKAGGATINLRNSVIAGSTGGDCFGRLTQNVSSLIEDGSCFAELSGDPGLSGLVIDLEEDPPDYPFLYLPVLSDILIDAAAARYCTETDQMGNTRPQGAGCDIGAIELATETGDED